MEVARQVVMEKSGGMAGATLCPLPRALPPAFVPCPFPLPAAAELSVGNLRNPERQWSWVWCHPGPGSRQGYTACPALGPGQPPPHLPRTPSPVASVSPCLSLPCPDIRPGAPGHRKPGPGTARGIWVSFHPLSLLEDIGGGSARVVTFYRSWQEGKLCKTKQKPKAPSSETRSPAGLGGPQIAPAPPPVWGATALLPPVIRGPM